MKRNIAALLTTLLVLSGCNTNYPTGSGASTLLGAGIGAGSVAVLGGSKTLMFLGGLGGGAIGYYVSTLRYDSGGVIQSGGQVYRVGQRVGIYIPSDQLFLPNSDEFTPQAGAILDSAVAVLQRYPDNNILISGNTSGFGQASWERQLSLKRAQKVSAHLWNAGINNFKDPSNDMRKLNYVGYGDYFPITSGNFTNTQIRQNSRIQITSYPEDCDLHMSQRKQEMYNIGALEQEFKS
jgi:outer membrane protein OmpA-like peptidoglycan-associated protein